MICSTCSLEWHSYYYLEVLNTLTTAPEDIFFCSFDCMQEFVVLSDKLEPEDEFYIVDQNDPDGLIWFGNLSELDYVMISQLASEYKIPITQKSAHAISQGRKSILSGE